MQAAEATPATPPDVESLGYEAARDALVDVVRRLETGGAPLEESLALWERGEALAARCQSWLDGARERLDAVRARSGGLGGAEDPGAPGGPGGPGRPGGRATSAGG